MKQESLQLVEQQLLQISRKVDELGESGEKILQASPRWLREQLAHGAPKWFDKVFARFLRLFIPSKKIKLQNIYSIFEGEEGPLESAGDIGLMFGHAFVHVERFLEVLPSFASTQKDEERQKFLLILKQTVSDLSTLLHLMVQASPWTPQEKDDYRKGFSQAYGNTITGYGSYVGEAPNHRFYMFLLFFWPYVRCFENLTKFHKFCVEQNLYKGDIASFRRLCDRNGVRLTTRGRKALNKTRPQ